jgi:pilus assembly protein CpaE
MRQYNVSRSRARKRSARRYAAPAASSPERAPAPEPAPDPAPPPSLRKPRRASDFARALSVAVDVEAACAANDSEPPPSATDADLPRLALSAANDDAPLAPNTRRDDSVEPAPAAQETVEAFGDLLFSPAGWETAGIAEEDPPFDPPDADDEIFHFRKDVSAPVTGAYAEQPLELTSPAPPAEPAERPVRPAPALTAHVAWDRPRCDDLLDALAADPRLKRVELTDAPGGVAGAVSRFSKQPSPDLLILHTSLSAQAICAELDRLACVIGAGTKVVVIGQVNDVGLLRELARRNIVHYMLAPARADELVRAICDLYEDNDNSRVIAVVGARGGAGASTIAHNLAWTIAERLDAPTTFAELDFAFGTTAFSLDHRPQRSIADGLAAPERIDEDFLDSVAIWQTERLRLLAAPGALAYDAKPDQRAVGALIRTARRMSAFVVLDVPHQWSSWTKDILVRADEVVIVAPPDLASLRNAKNLLDALRGARPPEREPLLILSMTGGTGPEISAKDFADAAGARPIVSIPFDPALFGMCAVKGRMISEAAPKSKAAETLDELAWMLTGRRPAKDGPRKKRAARARTAAAAKQEEAPPVLELRGECESKAVNAPAASVETVHASEPAPAAATSPGEQECFAEKAAAEAADEPGADDMAAAFAAFGALEPEKRPPRLEVVPSPRAADEPTPAHEDNVVFFPVESAPRRTRQRRLLQAANTPRRGRPGMVRAALLLAALVLFGALYAQRAAAGAPHAAAHFVSGA